jgi:hypothetical protein
MFPEQSGRGGFGAGMEDEGAIMSIIQQTPREYLEAMIQNGGPLDLSDPRESMVFEFLLQRANGAGHRDGTRGGKGMQRGGFGRGGLF